MYKLCTKILTHRLQKQLDENQPIEQAGSRSGYSTINHIHSKNQLIDKCTEYHKPIYLAFVDYEKAFQSVETNAALNTLQNQGIDQTYIDVLARLYENGYARLDLHKQGNAIPIRRGVRQGDSISPKLFTACLEDIVRNLNWSKRGISIHGRKLNNLRFADDVALKREKNHQEIEDCLNDLETESKKVGLKINIEKTKILRNKLTAPYFVKVGSHVIEEVDCYIYLVQRISLIDKDKSGEITRRIQAGSNAYNNYKELFKSNIPNSLKRKLHD